MKKSLSILLAVIMIVGMFPLSAIPAFAAEEAAPISETSSR